MLFEDGFVGFGLVDVLLVFVFQVELLLVDLKWFPGWFCKWLV